MDDIDEQEMRHQLIGLKEEHRDLDTAITALEALTYPDHLQIKRLKKKKLELRDKILRIEDELFPDIIA
ncbi:conserved protein [Tepidicaulis marinus]|jgi:hypothetical protein|uniref:Conserved protein n=1 Tax=Tepidicaulis marinus TaxID=1333998 RepID=A0A081BC74_9HYPH|nr:DUF465 domain-containing protein [Tepidicaulis marinus]GAK45642.1 conserved protein [Tepidicaulis marinus]